ncbi:MAG: Dabb family protein [Methylacidiphilales bacterium]|nr:Dabb family protein [Candidatus Methylacidiphilales bacterium]
MIRHTVVFKLRHSAGSPQERDFLTAIQKLADIPTVKNFERYRQVSKKNIYTFGLSMDFAGPADYQTYNQHPDHVTFVENRWKPEVTDFMEIDYEPLAINNGKLPAAGGGKTCSVESME